MYASFKMSRWAAELDAARSGAKAAKDVIRGEFGHRHITEYRGKNDVQLRADLLAEKVIVDTLGARFREYGIVSEETRHDAWDAASRIWAVDPLDGTNNFGYGVAHCATAITLFEDERVVLAVVYDPILDREFIAVEDGEFVGPGYSNERVQLARSTIALITGYAEDSRTQGVLVDSALRPFCKRIYNLWAPSLDLALVASGAIDAAICLGAAFLDVCAGIALIKSASGTVIDVRGNALDLEKRLRGGPVTFLASLDQDLAAELAAKIAGTIGPFPGDGA